MSSSREPSRSPDGDFPVLWSPPPAAQGSCKRLAGACLRRSSEIRRSARCSSTRPSAWDVSRPGGGTVLHAAVATVSRHFRGEVLSRPGQRQTDARRSAPRKQRRVHHRDDVVPVLARTVREVEAAARSGRVTPAVRTKFQAAALLLRDERARVRAAARSDSHRAGQLKRLDGVAAILATTAVQDAGLLALLSEGSGVSDAARSLKREMLRDLGIDPAPEEIALPQSAAASAGSERQVVPQSVIS